MRVFVINLDKDVSRYIFALEQSKRNGYEIERISGIYGKDLSEDMIKMSINKIGFYSNVGREPLIGEIGCALSHYKIYRK